MRNNRGAISLFTLISCLFFMIVLLGTYILITNKNQTQIKEISEIDQKIKDNKLDSKLVDIMFDSDPNSSDVDIFWGIKNYIKTKPGLSDADKNNMEAAATEIYKQVQTSQYKDQIKDSYKNAPNSNNVGNVIESIVKDAIESNVGNIDIDKETVEDAAKGPGIIETEDKTKISVLQASEDDAGLTLEEAARIFNNIYESSSDKEVLVNTLLSAYSKYEDGMSEEDAVMNAYKENPKDATNAVSQFLDLIPHMTKNELTSLTTAMTKASDLTDLTNIFATYRERQNLLTEEERKTFEERAFEETLEEDAVLYDDSIYTEYNPKFTITNIERPTQVYWSNDDEVGLTISVAGVVWKDAHGGLENNYDGIRGANANGELEAGIQGVKVTLIDQETGEVGKYYDTRNNLVDCITYTDEGGYYHFERVRVGKYDVEFEYDGQNYKTTELLAGGNVGD